MLATAGPAMFGIVNAGSSGADPICFDSLARLGVAVEPQMYLSEIRWTLFDDLLPMERLDFEHWPDSAAAPGSADDATFGDYEAAAVVAVKQPELRVPAMHVLRHQYARAVKVADFGWQGEIELLFALTPIALESAPGPGEEHPD